MRDARQGIKEHSGAPGQHNKKPPIEAALSNSKQPCQRTCLAGRQTANCSVASAPCNYDTLRRPSISPHADVLPQSGPHRVLAATQQRGQQPREQLRIAGGAGPARSARRRHARRGAASATALGAASSLLLAGSGRRRRRPASGPAGHDPNRTPAAERPRHDVRYQGPLSGQEAPQLSERQVPDSSGKAQVGGWRSSMLLWYP
jgi:hypothetical protein